MDFNGIKRAYTIKDGDELCSKKSDLLYAVFQTRHNDEHLSLQRFDSNWDEYIDVDVGEVKDRDKLKFIVINKHDSQDAIAGLETPDKSVSAAAINHLVINLEDEKSSLEFRLNIAKATLSSLKDVPKTRPYLGRNKGFTCSNCHYKGHRISACQQPSCGGYCECGQLTLHKEHRDLIKEVK